MVIKLQMNQVSNFNIVMVGAAGVGTSTFIGRHQTGEFTKAYQPTVGSKTTVLEFNSNIGPFTLTITDYAGQEIFNNQQLMETRPSAAIVMFAVDNKLTFSVVDHYLEQLVNIPIVLTGNKVDVIDRKVSSKTIANYLQTRKGKVSSYYDISAKSNYNYEKPFLYILRCLTGRQDLVFTEFSP